jgi:hypothetical protein
MKTRHILTLLWVIAFFSACSQKEEVVLVQTTDDQPNLVIVGTDRASAFVHPSELFAWLSERRPNRIYIGQINMFRVGTNVYAVTAPHVLSSSDLQYPFPTSQELGNWSNSVDGKEITFAKLRDWRKLGFTVEPVETMEPQLNTPATIKTTMFTGAKNGVKNLEIVGILELVSSPEQIKQVGEVMNQGTSFRDRLLSRAPTQPFLAMVVHEDSQEFLVGSSGSLVWQNGHPVGVFVAAFFTKGQPPLVFIEPLLNSVVTMKM